MNDKHKAPLGRGKFSDKYLQVPGRHQQYCTVLSISGDGQTYYIRLDGKNYKQQIHISNIDLIDSDEMTDLRIKIGDDEYNRIQQEANQKFPNHSAMVIAYMQGRMEQQVYQFEKKQL